MVFMEDQLKCSNLHGEKEYIWGRWVCPIRASQSVTLRGTRVFGKVRKQVDYAKWLHGSSTGLQLDPLYFPLWVQHNYNNVFWLVWPQYNFLPAVQDPTVHLVTVIFQVKFNWKIDDLKEGERWKDGPLRWTCGTEIGRMWLAWREEWHHRSSQAASSFSPWLFCAEKRTVYLRLYIASSCLDHFYRVYAFWAFLSFPSELNRSVIKKKAGLWEYADTSLLAGVQKQRHYTALFYVRGLAWAHVYTLQSALTFLSIMNQLAAELK